MELASAWVLWCLMLRFNSYCTKLREEGFKKGMWRLSSWVWEWRAGLLGMAWIGLSALGGLGHDPWWLSMICIGSTLLFLQSKGWLSSRSCCREALGTLFRMEAAQASSFSTPSFSCAFLEHQYPQGAFFLLCLPVLEHTEGSPEDEIRDSRVTAGSDWALWLPFSPFRSCQAHSEILSL